MRARFPPESRALTILLSARHNAKDVAGDMQSWLTNFEMTHYRTALDSAERGVPGVNPSLK